MQRKFIKQEEWQSNIRPEERFTFSRESPVSSISRPPNAIGFALHGNYTVHGAQGTTYVLRIDAKDQFPLNIDEYAFDSHPDEDHTAIQDCPKPEYHHTDRIPAFMESQAPEWLKAQVQKALAELSLS